MNDICELTEAELDLVAGGLANDGPGLQQPICWIGCAYWGESYRSVDLTQDILNALG